MAANNYSVTLASQWLPLSISELSNNVIMLGADTAYKRSLLADNQQDPSLDLPQAAYCRDYLPTIKGFVSANYKPLSDTTGLEGAEPLSKMHYLRGTASDEYLKVMLVRVGGVLRLRVNYPGSADWGGFVFLESGINLGIVGDVPQIYTFRIQGVDYIFIQNSGVYTHVWEENAFAKVELSGLEFSALVGMLSASGYALAFSRSAIAWSTTLDILPAPSERSAAVVLDQLVYHKGYTFKCTTAGTTSGTEPNWLVNIVANPVGEVIADGTANWTRQRTVLDFEPSEITGAGGGELEEIEGFIVSAMPVAGGFIIFCTRNAVAAIYANNVSYPFNFKPITGSAGISDYRHVTKCDKAYSLYAFTLSGLQRVALTGATPELTNWTSGIERIQQGGEWAELAISEHTGLSVTKSTGTLQELEFCAGRYLCARLGDLTLVFDTTLQRPGALKGLSLVYDYTPVEEDDAPVVPGMGGIGAIRYAQQVVATILAGGADANRVLLLGVFKHAMGKDITLLNVAVNCTDPMPINTPDVVVLFSYDEGRTFPHFEYWPVGASQNMSGRFEAQGNGTEAQTVAVALIKGNMSIVGAELEYTVGSSSK